MYYAYRMYIKNDSQVTRHMATSMEMKMKTKMAAMKMIYPTLLYTTLPSPPRQEIECYPVRPAESNLEHGTARRHHIHDGTGAEAGTRRTERRRTEEQNPTKITGVV